MPSNQIQHSVQTITKFQLLIIYLQALGDQAESSVNSFHIHQVQLRACQPATQPTNLNSKPSGCCTGNLEISELASKLRVDEP